MAEDNGFIVLHRKIQEWEWYTDGNTMRLFIHLLLIASHKNYSWRGIEIKRGQVMTGRKVLSSETGMSEQEIRTALNKLKSTNEITITATKKYSIVTVNNYGAYQDKKECKQPSNQPSNQPTINQEATTYNNENNDNKKNKSIGSKKSASRFVAPSKQETADFFLANESTVQEAGKFWYHFNGQDWFLGNRQKMKDWQKAAMKWIYNSKTKYAATNGGSNGIPANNKWAHSSAMQQFADQVRAEEAAREQQGGLADGSTGVAGDLVHREDGPVLFTSVGTAQGAGPYREAGWPIL